MGLYCIPVAGIYTIKCMVNKKIYVGKSVNVAGRWATHLSQLLTGKHSCKHLQADFSRYGAESFTFSILEVVGSESDLCDSEARWFRSFDRATLYNSATPKLKIITSKESIDLFVDYVNSKWLASDGNFEPYCIWRKEDRDEITAFAFKTGLIDVYPQDMTFMKAVKEVLVPLGYTVNSGRKRIGGVSQRFYVITAYSSQLLSPIPNLMDEHP